MLGGVRTWATVVLGAWVVAGCGDRLPARGSASASGAAPPRPQPVAEAVVEPPPPPVLPVPEPIPDRSFSIELPARVVLEERERLAMAVSVDGPGADDARLFVLGLPPGASWDEAARTLHFRPDFIQGGQAWSVTFVADDGNSHVEGTTVLEVVDSIQPPEPIIDGEEIRAGYTRLLLSQVTDDFLDEPMQAGRTFDALVTRPRDVPPGERRPVLVLLHGLLQPPHRTGADDRFVIGPHDPESTYWWGYRGEDDGAQQVPPYTQRRVLALLEWVLRREPAADPDRVFIAGRSMGGAGAATLGLMRARHFAGIDAWLWQAIPRNHRPYRLAQLSGLWGAPEEARGDGESVGVSVWDTMDLTRVLLDSPEARDQWLFSRHGKDDPVIHFGATVLPSPLTGLSLYQALQRARAGHWVVWDEGGHNTWDPRLGADWWREDWDPAVDPVTFLRRDLAFVAFSRASHDDEPGDGGSGRRPWHPNRGYGGVVERPGDTGWNGDPAGSLNRSLRWDARAIVDDPLRFEVPLRALEGLGGPWPVVADATLRRVQAFRCRPGERVTWRFGPQRGEAQADDEGDLTIPGLELDPHWQILAVERTE